MQLLEDHVNFISMIQDSNTGSPKYKYGGLKLYSAALSDLVAELFLSDLEPTTVLARKVQEE
jgi:hypothetical protein